VNRGNLVLKPHILVYTHFLALKLRVVLSDGKCFEIILILILNSVSLILVLHGAVFYFSLLELYLIPVTPWYTCMHCKQ